MARAFVHAGFACVSPTQKADVYVVNTCSVTHHSDKKCGQAIRKLTKINPFAFIAVTGCYAQLQPREVAAIPGVQLVVGAQYKNQLVERVLAALAHPSAPGVLPPKAVLASPCEDINSFFSAYSAGEGDEGRTRSFLKVQDGCDYRCAYCTVPLARGASRNIPIAQLVTQAHEIARSGVREIVLTGVNTGHFGKTTGETFFDLLKALATVPGIDRYRISSIEPNLLTPPIIAWLAEQPTFMPHFHIPLQSGCDTVLQRMQRRYNTDLFASRIACIRTHMPFAFIGIDVIAGFVGETEAEFDTTYTFLQRLAPSFLHVFPYSVRANTVAASWPVTQRVNPAVITDRAHRLGLLSDQLHSNFVASNAQRQEQVLFEGRCKDGMMHGYTRNYIRVERPFDASLINEIVDVIL